ncbi:MAG: hypothetical protein ACP5LP_03010 [Candidatus Micrarchaeia archaeon]
MERVITISIRKYLSTQPRTKRINKAVKYVRERVAHYTKTDIKNVKLGRDVNEAIFKKYAKDMTPIKLSVNREKDILNVSLFGVKQATPETKEKEVKEKKAEAKQEKNEDKQENEAGSQAKPKPHTTKKAAEAKAAASEKPKSKE